MLVRTWRLRNYRKAKGVYRTLETGRNETRVSIALGYGLTDEQAETALQAMNADESKTIGTPKYGRVERLFKEDREAAVRFLIGDPAVDDLFGPAPVDHGQLRLSDYFEQVYKPWRMEHNPRSWRTERGDWSRILGPGGLGDTKLKDIDEHSVDAYLEERLRKVNGAPATWNMKRKHRNAIAALLTYARRKKHYTRPMPSWFKLTGSSQRTLAQPEPLTFDEVERLLGGVQGHGPNERAKLRALFAVAFSEGLRPSEAVSLDWSDIDWQAPHANGIGTMSILRSTPDGGVTKTRTSKATIPLFPLAHRELTAWWENRGCPSEGLIFPARGGEPYSLTGNRATFRRALKAAAKRAGFGDRRIFPYLGRHSAGTALVADGAPIDTVAKVLRHSSPAMLRKHYDHTGALRAPGLERAFQTAPAPVEELTSEVEVEENPWLALVGQ